MFSRLWKTWCLSPGLVVAATLNVVPGDSDRGAKLFDSEQCVQCHSVNGRGGKMGVDLARAVPRNFTPSHLASAMWNHAPTMWTVMQSKGIQQPRLTAEQAADLFAHFYSQRFFDASGDATIGRATFTAKQCSVCHGIDKSLAEE